MYSVHPPCHPSPRSSPLLSDRSWFTISLFWRVVVPVSAETLSDFTITALLPQAEGPPQVSTAGKIDDLITYLYNIAALRAVDTFSDNDEGQRHWRGDLTATVNSRCLSTGVLRTEGPRFTGVYTSFGSGKPEQSMIVT